MSKDNLQNKKISIVTPTYQSAKYLEKCIQSIISQNYDNFEHIIVDGGSTDGTLDIIKKYENQYPMKWVSEKDNGMYDAINKGFQMADGEIFAWLNSDDEYLPWAFQTMNKVMWDDSVSWCTTGPAFFANEEGMFFFTNRTLGPRSYSRKLLKKGWYNGIILGFVQQEATFWTRDLWEKSNGLNPTMRYAGDYWLWRKFAEFETLYSINTVISVFRKRSGQLSSNTSAYNSELPKVSGVLKFLGKTKLISLVFNLLHPFHRNLLQIEDKEEKDHI